jgi:hypothetical protein
VRKQGYFKCNKTDNHYCSGKAINIKYSECVFVGLGTQHATFMLSIVICVLSGSTKFSTLSHNGTMNIKFAFRFSLHFLWNISHFKKWARYDKKRILVSIFINLFFVPYLTALLLTNIATHRIINWLAINELHQVKTLCSGVISGIILEFA